ncbi:MAG: FkbM family methyltransferase [Defluviitaleaceae bacterium]|nr:FkbM family methyltransferase [Defluviitaleaceae bacterium]
MTHSLLKRVTNKIRNKKVELRIKKQATKRAGVQFVGSSYGGFNVIPSCLQKNSIVYSFGIGEDISFDLGILDLTPCTVFAFDPTPKSIEFLKNIELPDKFIFTPCAVASKDGALPFNLPLNPNHVSGSLVDASHLEEKALLVPAKTIKSIMESFGHKHIDLIKMDIEGSEFEVIENMLQDVGSCFSQLCVEVHHWFFPDGEERLNKMIALLKKAGYEIFSVTKDAREMSFIRTNDK